MNILSIISALAALILLSGCGSTPTPPAKKTPPPAWVNAVLPNDTTTTMYGMAIAKNRVAAIKAALNDMISRLSVTIESQFQSQEKVINNYYSSSVTNSDIKASVSAVKINNYKVIKSHKLNYREFAVMIATDKQKFVEGLKEELAVKQQFIKQKMSALASEDKISQYNSSKAMAKEAKDLLSVILILSSIDKSYDAKKDRDFVFGVEKKFISISHSLKFYVHGDSKSKPFVDKIKNNLAQNGFNLSSKSTDSVAIKVQTKDNINSGSVKIAVLTMNISVTQKNKRVGGKINIIKERYNSSISSVYKNAAIHFEQDILKQGINELLGIHLDTEK